VSTSPEQCHEYSRCSAPVCPLDGQWREHVHIEGEAVCKLALQMLKEPGGNTLLAHLPPDMTETLRQEVPAMLAAYGDIRRKVERAAKQGRRAANLENGPSQKAG